MGGIGLLIQTATRVGGRILGRIAGPLGAAVAIGEIGYLGLKYSGTLENFKKLYCDKCRAEIPMQYVGKVSSKLEVGTVFDAVCERCDQPHAIAKVNFLCVPCRDQGKAPEKLEKIAAPKRAKFLFLTCPACSKPIKFAKNKTYKP